MTFVCPPPPLLPAQSPSGGGGGGFVCSEGGCSRREGGGGRPGQRVEEQGTWASCTQKHSEAGYGRPVD